MRIAVVGGMFYSSRDLDGFLFKLYEKHPTATIVTGQGKGAEQHAAESARLLGFNVEQLEVTEDHERWFGSAALDCQVSSILSGADIIICVSNGGRVKLATEWWHRMNMHQRDQRGGLVKKKGELVSLRSPENRVPLFNIAAATREQAKAEKLAA